MKNKKKSRLAMHFFLGLSCVAALVGAQFIGLSWLKTQSAQGYGYGTDIEFKINSFTIRNIDALAHVAEDVRTFNVVFNKPVSGFSLKIINLDDNSLFMEKYVNGGIAAYYMSPGDWGGKKLKPNTKYKVLLDATDQLGQILSHEEYFETSNFAVPLAYTWEQLEGKLIRIAEWQKQYFIVKDGKKNPIPHTPEADAYDEAIMKSHGHEKADAIDVPESVMLQHVIGENMTVKANQGYLLKRENGSTCYEVVAEKKLRQVAPGLTGNPAGSNCVYVPLVFFDYHYAIIENGQPIIADTTDSSKTINDSTETLSIIQEVKPLTESKEERPLSVSAETGSNVAKAEGEKKEDDQISGSQNKTITNNGLYKKLQGRIILAVERKGEAYYVNPSRQTSHFLGRPTDAFAVMRSQGVGIKNLDLEKIPLGLVSVSGPDADADGLTDLLEDAIGTDKSKPDSDGDGFADKSEILNGYSARGAGKAAFDRTFAQKHQGKIFLQIEGAGEAWYVNPADGKRYFLGRPADAFAAMRALSLGISNENLDNM